MFYLRKSTVTQFDSRLINIINIHMNQQTLELMDELAEQEMKDYWAADGNKE